MINSIYRCLMNIYGIKLDKLRMAWSFNYIGRHARTSELSCLPGREVANLVAVRKQWAECPDRIRLWLQPKGVTSSTGGDGLTTPQGGPREEVLAFRNTLMKQPCSAVCPVRRSSPVSRYFFTRALPATSISCLGPSRCRSRATGEEWRQV